jgi:hypothetical protein
VATLVAAEAIAILLLAVLVAGLLRSHADILRTLHRLENGPSMAGAGTGAANSAVAGLRIPTGMPVASQGAGGVRRPGFDLVGVSPTGDVVQVGLLGTRHNTLLAFFSTGCESCGALWQALQGGPVAVPGGARLVIVTKGPEEESPPLVESLAPTPVTTIMSSAAWSDYQVPVYPYFVYVHGPSGQVIGEGAAGSWSQITSLLGQALAEAGLVEPPLGPSIRDQRSRIDDDLAAAGIYPGHPSLHPPVVLAATEDRDERRQ